MDTFNKLMDTFIRLLISFLLGHITGMFICAVVSDIFQFKAFYPGVYTFIMTIIIFILFNKKKEKSGE